MKKIIYICDGCGEEIEGDPEVFGFGIRDSKTGMVCTDEDRNTALELDNRDFCPACTRKLADFIMNLGKEEPKVPLKPGEMKIDKSSQPDWMEEIVGMLKDKMNDRQIIAKFPDKDPEEVKAEIQMCREKIEKQLMQKILDGNRRPGRPSKTKS